MGWVGVFVEVFVGDAEGAAEAGGSDIVDSHESFPAGAA